MQTTPFSLQQLNSSVIAVPPLARAADFGLAVGENRRIVSHIESGGVQTLLYGGNANLYHMSLREYPDLLRMLEEIADSDTLMIPSAGPAYGTMMDQAEILRDFDFPTVMILPQREVATSSGIATGTRNFAERIDRPIVLYIKHDRNLDVDDIAQLVNDGIVSFIKYAVVREDPNDDNYLREITDAVDSKRIVSGIGEQPAIVHMRDFSLAGFTSGCVCLAPSLSMNMLNAINASDYETAESIRRVFEALEDHRNSINPIRVLHAAVEAAGIAKTGPLMPLLSPVGESETAMISTAAIELLGKNVPVPH